MKKPFLSASEAFEFFPSLYGKNYDFQKERYENAFAFFKEKFNATSAYMASSSGRVEVVGNHTDHNGGMVLCTAISLDTLAMFLPTDDDKIHIVSEGYPDIIIDVCDLVNTKIPNSESLVKGVLYATKQRGYKVGGFNAYITSNVLGGAGISSSASFEVLIAEILNFLYNDGVISCQEKSFIAQFAEREFFGKPCGLLDQSAIAYGGLNKIDFSSKTEIKVTPIDDKIKDFSLVLVNTGGTHDDLIDEYASIPAEMKAVAKCFDKECLINVCERDFYKNVKNISIKVSDRAICRAVHFYEENERVELASKALENGDFDSFAGALNASGQSSLYKLQNCFVPKSDNQPIVKAIALCSKITRGGAVRIHGGGFAGCILCIVKNVVLDDFISDVKCYYDDKDIIILSVRDKGAIVL